MNQIPALLCNLEDSVLAIIDIQTRLAAAMPPDRLEQVKANTVKLLTGAQKLLLPIIFTEQYPKGLGHTEPEVKKHLPKTAERVEKTYFSAGADDRFAESLQITGRKQIIICGMEAHVCVLQTALQLRATGFQVFVVQDAICSRTEHNADNAVSRMAQAGVVITNTESVLFEWLKDARHDAFKDISALVR